MPAPRWATMGAMLLDRAASLEESCAYRFLHDGGGGPEVRSYRALTSRALDIATFLLAKGCAKRPVLILLPTGMAFVEALFGCFLAGAIAVPAPPPTGTRGLPRIRGILADCAPPLALVVEPPQIDRLGGGDDAPLARTEWVRVADIPACATPDPSMVEAVAPGDIAVLQYTSGSTGTPKGVVISHRNALINLAQQKSGMRAPDGARLVSWLPVHHDMGLFGNILITVAVGGELSFMAPSSFLQKPIRWVQAISDYRGQASGGPDFGFDLCARRAQPADLAALDLSSWTTAYSGAEPVRAATLERFARVFAASGFRCEALRPCYGLAEATLIVSVQAVTQSLDVRRYDRQSLFAGIARQSDDGEALTSCGPAVEGMEIAIVDAATSQPLPDNRVGEIWLSGPNLAEGYWNQPQMTAKRFGARLAGRGDRWLRSGDVGFLDRGQLFVVGRADDMIILRGRNIPPDDIENAALVSPIQVAGSAVALAAPDEGGVILVQEVARGQGARDFPLLGAQMRAAVADATETALSRIAFVRFGSIPRTTSGKIRRRETGLLLARDALPIVHDDRGGRPAEGEEAGPAPASADPQTPPLERLRLEAARLLGLEKPPMADTPLVALGIDSLRAAELADWVAETFGTSLPLSTFFTETATLAEIARAIGSSPQSGGLALFPPPAAVARDVVPLTRGQQTLWVAARRAPESVGNTLSLGVVVGETPPQTLQSALDRLSLAHPLLRSVFRLRENDPVRVVHAQPEVTIAPIVWHGEDEGREEALDAFLRQPLVLEDGPPWRAGLLRNGRSTLLVLALHHILADGRALVLLGKALAAEIDAGTTAAPDDAPAADRFAEAVGEDEAYLCRPEAWRALTFFRQSLADLPDPLPLAPAGWDGRPAPRPRIVSLPISPSRLAGLKRSAAVLGSPPARLMFGLFVLALARLTSRDDLVVSVVSTNRPAGQAMTIGYFANPLPVRLHLGLEATAPLDRVLIQAMAALSTTLDHRLLPFSEIVRAAVRPGEAQRLLQCVFTHVGVDEGFQGDLASALAVAQDRPVPFLLRPQEGEAALALTFVEGGGGARLDLAIDDGAVAAAIGQALPTMIGNLATALAEAPHLPLSGVPAMAASVLERMGQWESGPRAALALREEGWSLGALFVRAVRDHAARVALEAGRTRWTYDVLGGQVAAIASQLQDLDLRPGDVVALHMAAGPLWVACLLATLVRGLSFLTLDPSHPAERNHALLEGARAKVVMAAPGLPPLAELPTLVPADPDARTPALSTLLVALSEVDATPAYVIFTSGSTGKPKGVVVAQGGLRDRLLWKIEALDLGPGERVLQSMQTIFDPALWETLAPLLAGSTLVIADPEVRSSPRRLAETLLSAKITVATCISGMVGPLGQALAGLGGKGDDLALRRIVAGGEALPNAVARAFVEQTGARIEHFYGPTEATIFCTHQGVGPADTLPEDGILPIGRPVAGARVAIVDLTGAPCPPGVIGMVDLSGIGLALGYLGADGAVIGTGGGFRQHGESRVYASGDLGRWRSDGRIEVLGRQDTQVKIRGVRIDLAEVEAVLLAHSLVGEAAVIAAKRAGVSTLHAFVTGDQDIDSEALRKDLAGRLPPAMRPTTLRAVSGLPRLANGKIDRAALDRQIPEATGPALPAATAPLGPQEPLEATLLRCWQQVLAQPDLGVTDDLFERGGHSLLALRVCAMVEDISARVIALDPLLRNVSVREQARAILAGNSGRDDKAPTLTRLSTTASGPDFVCIAAGFGDLRRLKALADALGPRANVWGLFPPALLSAGPAGLAELIAAYRQILLQRFGARPFALAGFSVGGVIGLELAATLRAEGLAIDHLVLLDSVFPFLMKLNLRLHDLLRAMVTFRWTNRLMRFAFGRRLRRFFMDEGLSAHLKAAAYCRQKFGGTVTVVRSRAARPFSAVLFWPWRLRAKRLAWEDASGFHGSMFSADHVGSLAEAVARLNAATSLPPPP
ncbi:aspartate racemase, partial [Rhodospirillum rubrum]|nr:aspartate racemase [Rhodospirillum rubrum]